LLARRAADQIVGDMPDDGEVGWGIFGPHSAFVVAESHVHDPVQTVLDAPVIAYRRPHPIGGPGG
jgi:hypothetical protein